MTDGLGHGEGMGYEAAEAIASSLLQKMPELSPADVASLRPLLEHIRDDASHLDRAVIETLQRRIGLTDGKSGGASASSEDEPKFSEAYVDFLQLMITSLPSVGDTITNLSLADQVSGRGGLVDVPLDVPAEISPEGCHIRNCPQYCGGKCGSKCSGKRS